MMYLNLSLLPIALAPLSSPSPHANAETEEKIKVAVSDNKISFFINCSVLFFNNQAIKVPSLNSKKDKLDSHLINF